MYHNFIHSSVNGHLSCFYVFAIVNRAAIKVGCMYHFGSCFSQGMIAFRIDWFDLPCSPRDSQEFSLVPWFKSMSSLVLRLLYGPTLTSIQDGWKSHRFD